MSGDAASFLYGTKMPREGGDAGEVDDDGVGAEEVVEVEVAAVEVSEFDEVEVDVLVVESDSLDINVSVYSAAQVYERYSRVD